jgi:hypothetical protein
MRCGLRSLDMATAQNSIPKFGWLDWFDMNQEKTNGILIFNFWTIPTIPKFPKGFCFGFQGEETFRDSASDSASIHCIVNIEQFAEPQDLLVKTMVFCNFPSNDLLHLRSLRVASGQSDFQKAWNYFLSRPHWVWLNIKFFFFVATI